MAIDLHSVILCFLCFTSVVSLSGFYAGDESSDELTTSTAILILRLLCNTLVQEVSLDSFSLPEKERVKKQHKRFMQRTIKKNLWDQGPVSRKP